jgi:hypothetical protein
MAVATDSLSMTDIASDLKNYAYDHKEYIISRLLSIGFGGVPNSPIKALDEFAMMLPTSGEVVLTDLIMGDPLQPGGKDSFDPKNNVAKFKTRKASVKPVKVDLKFSHTKILAMYNTYMGRVKTQKIDPETYPFEEFVITELLKSIQKYMRLALWSAIEDENDLSYLGLFNGWKKQILDIIANEPASINVIDIAVITGNNAVAQLEIMKKSLPEEIRYGGEAVLIVDSATKDFYEENYRTLHGSLPYNQGFTKQYLDGTNIEIIVEQGVAGFGRPIITPKDNLVFLYDDLNKLNDVDFDYQKRDRSLAYLMDAFTGAGIAATERIYIGDGA